MREEEEKNSMDTKSPSDVFCTSLSCERERDFFVAVNVSDGCWRNYNMRGLKLFCFLSVREITIAFFL